MSPPSRLESVFLYLVATVAVIVALCPVLWMVSISFKPPLEAFAVPPRLVANPTIENYVFLFTRGVETMGTDVPLHARNSLLVSFVTTLITLAVGILAAYSLARFQWRGRNAFAGGILFTRMMPPIAMLVPLFLLVLRVGLIDTPLALIIAYTGINLPLGIWLLRSFIEDVPRELEEAAWVDGCSRLHSLRRVTIPLIAPGIMVAGFFAFIQSWNEFGLALALTSQRARTLPLLVMSFLTDQGTLWGPMAATGSILLIPPILFIGLCHKYLERGLTVGGVKG